MCQIQDLCLPPGEWRATLLLETAWLEKRAPAWLSAIVAESRCTVRARAATGDEKVSLLLAAAGLRYADCGPSSRSAALAHRALFHTPRPARIRYAARGYAQGAVSHGSHGSVSWLWLAMFLGAPHNLIVWSAMQLLIGYYNWTSTSPIDAESAPNVTIATTCAQQGRQALRMQWNDLTEFPELVFDDFAKETVALNSFLAYMEEHDPALNRQKINTEALRFDGARAWRRSSLYFPRDMCQFEASSGAAHDVLVGLSAYYFPNAHRHCSFPHAVRKGNAAGWSAGFRSDVKLLPQNGHAAPTMATVTLHRRREPASGSDSALRHEAVSSLLGENQLPVQGLSPWQCVTWDAAPVTTTTDLRLAFQSALARTIEACARRKKVPEADYLRSMRGVSLADHIAGVRAALRPAGGAALDAPEVTDFAVPIAHSVAMHTLAAMGATAANAERRDDACDSE